MKRVVLRLIWQGIRDLSLNPWAQVATLGAVALVAFLSGLFLMALTSLDAQLGMVRGETVFQVYWHPGTDKSQIEEQWQSYPLIPGFQYLNTYTPEEALSELGVRLGRGKGNLEKNFPFLAEKSPLPATAIVAFVPDPGRDLERWLADTARLLESRPGVDRVAVTPLRDELGRAWRKVSRYVVWPSVAFLTLVLGLMVGNTIRLALIARSHEIEILRMIGAFRWYIRLPLVVGGCLQGLCGGLLALGLLALLHGRIRDVLNFPPLLMQIYFPPWPLATALVIVPMLMGGLASWLAVRKQ
ncbi:MAG: permease [Desulfovibrionaceae bacterium]|nr:permease [Desulfovibrionaceae bacterium]